MTHFTIFQGSNKLQCETVEVESIHKIGFAKKILKLDNSILLLNHEATVYKGELQIITGETTDKIIKLSRLKTEVSDFALDVHRHFIYFLRHGTLYRSSCSTFDDDLWEQVMLDTYILNIYSNNLGLLFVNRDLELYGLGDFGDVQKSDTPKVFDCFQGLKCLKVACGDDFVICLTQYKAKFLDTLPNDAKLDEFLVFGETTLSTCVWSFGSINKGHLGTGDHIKRTGINVVLGLQNKSVIDIACGREHSVALTLTGHVYVWGNNSHQQILSEKVENISYPKLATENVLAVCCGADNIITLSDSLNISNQKSVQSNTIPAIDYLTIPGIDHIDIPLVLALDKNVFLINHVQLQRKLIRHFKDEQSFLEKQLYIDAVVKLHKRTLQIDSFDEFYRRHEALLYLTTSHLKSLHRYFFTSHTEDILIAHSQYYSYFHTVFVQYIKDFCDNYAIGLFTKPNIDQATKILEDIKAIHDHIDTYTALLNDLTLPTKELELQIASWTTIQQNTHEQIEVAKKTCKFWQNALEKLLPLKEPTRRFLLSSLDAPLKSSQNNLFSTTLFVLFNDCLVLVNQQLITHSLKLIWLTPLSSKRYAFEIITPEEIIVVRANNAKDQKLWFETLEKACEQVLAEDGVNRYGYRNSNYDFSAKHSKYPNGKYCGEWSKGKLNGIGYLVILPMISNSSNNQQSGIFDGRIYNGQFVDNSIQGYGSMEEFVGGDKMSTYYGDFEDGKYNGYGEIQNFKTGDTYKGFFNRGLYHGFGELTSIHQNFLGEFLNNFKSGYGVLDDRLTGEKYMGMFLLNKKSGAGFMVTQNGDYFEGNFNDVLSENGMAIFQNGSYYRGDLNLQGPKGKGTFFFGGHEITDDQLMQPDQPNVIGNTLSGILSGTWENIKIENGNFKFNETYPMTPSIFSSLIVDINSKKWFSIFYCWRLQVFGTNDLTTIKNKTLWVKITNFMISTKNRKELRANNFERLSIKDTIPEDPPSPLRNASTLATLQMLRASISDSKINILNRSFVDFKTTSSLSNSTEAIDVEVADLKERIKSQPIVDANQFCPKFGIEGQFDGEVCRLINEYLVESFNNEDHPLGYLVTLLMNSFSAAYINWKVKPIALLADIAVGEFESIVERVYDILKFLFPALPDAATFIEGKLFTQKVLLYPFLLKDSIHSILFMLFASKCSQKDEIYRQRLKLFDKKNVDEIIEIIQVDAELVKLIKHENFTMVVEDFRKFKDKFCPFEMLEQIEQSFLHFEETKVVAVGSNFALCADRLITLTMILIVINQIPQLGAELQMMEFLMASDMEKVMHMQCGYCFTTLKATYQHFISDSFLT